MAYTQDEAIQFKKKKIPFSRSYIEIPCFFPVVGILGLFPIFPLNGHPGKADSYFSSCLLKPLALLRTSDFKLLLFSTSVKH